MIRLTSDLAVVYIKGRPFLLPAPAPTSEAVTAK